MAYSKTADAAEAGHIPHDPAFDSTLALLTEGYRFIGRRCDAFGADWFSTRLMLRKVLCVRGAEAARMFYEPGRFTRRGALPPTTLSLLQGRGSAATLDGPAHAHRKALFMSLMAPQRIAQLVEQAAVEWRQRFSAWQGGGRVVLLREAEQVLCSAVCRWAGVPLNAYQAELRSTEFAAMVAGAGSAGPRNWGAQLLRLRCEHWAAGLIDAARAGRIDAGSASALNMVARHRGLDGKPLPRKIAAIELINVLRPTVAVARYIVFAALALHEFPACARRIAAEGEPYLDWFAQEVRRYYPFFPAVGGRVLAPFDWHGHRFAQGDWVLLDLYGTSHDARLWPEPEQFRPERFDGWRGDGFELIPQGGGDALYGHRCAGEGPTLALLKSAARLLATEIRYTVPRQDLRVKLSRMPARPASGLVIDCVQLASG